MSRSCSTVRPLTGLAGLTTGTMASTAMAVRCGFTPFFLAASTSLSLMSRELMAMSHCFSSRALRPLPEPPPEMLSSTPGCAAIKASPAFCTTGSTVVEPLITTCPAAKAGALKLSMARARTNFLPINMNMLLCCTLVAYAVPGGPFPAAFPFWPASVTE